MTEALAASATRPPSEETLRKHIKTIVDSNDLSQLSLKTVRRDLETRLDMQEGSLDADKQRIKDIVTVEIQRKQQEEDADSSAPLQSTPKKAQATYASQVKNDKEKAGSSEKGATKKRQLDLMTKSQFQKQAEEVIVKIGDKKMKLAPRTFSTGSSGYFSNGKVELPCGDQTLMCQVQINCTVIGSKAWAEG